MANSFKRPPAVHQTGFPVLCSPGCYQHYFVTLSILCEVDIHREEAGGLSTEAVWLVKNQDLSKLFKKSFSLTYYYFNKRVDIKKYNYYKGIKLKKKPNLKLFGPVAGHVSGVICPVSFVTCCVSPVTSGLQSWY